MLKHCDYYILLHYVGQNSADFNLHFQTLLRLILHRWRRFPLHAPRRAVALTSRCLRQRMVREREKSRTKSRERLSLYSLLLSSSSFSLSLFLFLSPSLPSQLNYTYTLHQSIQIQKQTPEKRGAEKNKERVADNEDEKYKRRQE